MADIFDVLVARAPAWLSYLANREVPERPGDRSLDPDVFVRADRTVLFEQQVAEWPDPQAMFTLLEVMHDMDLERAAQPPVVNVSITPPDGTPAIGYLQVDTRNRRRMTFVVGRTPPQPARKLVELTRQARDRLRHP